MNGRAAHPLILPGSGALGQQGIKADGPARSRLREDQAEGRRLPRPVQGRSSSRAGGRRGGLRLRAARSGRCRPGPGAGANLVVATEPAADRAAIAGRMGADRVLSGERGRELADELRDATDGRGFDVVVDATGAAAEVLPEAERIVAVGGHVVHLGVGGPAAPMHPIVTMVNGTTHSFSMGHLGGFDPVIALQAVGRIDLTPMVTARYPITSGLEALAHAATRNSAKTLVTAGAD
ncbi:zinc-binding dehydrogenase [Streptomyces scabiei]|uniref:zinc-binding dehydrogenase n=1 Tax=Streptomyces scabiei TaxID=1930 RepID=UPI0024A632DE|nr:zinc-binding dehydrogenase [Streptomyces sp. LBUM 1482]